jgi:hypothetical protein
MVKFTVLPWAVCWLVHRSRSLGHCATELLCLIIEDDHFGNEPKQLEHMFAKSSSNIPPTPQKSYGHFSFFCVLHSKKVKIISYPQTIQ